MIVQRNSSPWVILAVIVMAGCAISGMMLGNVGPFNRQVVEARIPIQQTQGALSSLATQAVMAAAQTQQAPISEGTVVAAQMTLMPMQQAATQIAAAGQVLAIQAVATQTAAANELENAQLQAQATQTTIANNLLQQSMAGVATATAVARRQNGEQMTKTAQGILFLIALLVVTGWIAAHLVIKVINARAQEKAAAAKMLAEQRRMAALRASIEAQRVAQQYPTPASLMKRPKNGKGLPKAE